MHRHILALFAAGILLLTTTNYCAGGPIPQDDKDLVAGEGGKGAAGLESQPEEHAPIDGSDFSESRRVDPSGAEQGGPEAVGVPLGAGEANRPLSPESQPSAAVVPEVGSAAPPGAAPPADFLNQGGAAAGSAEEPLGAPTGEVAPTSGATSAETTSAASLGANPSGVPPFPQPATENKTADVASSIDSLSTAGQGTSLNQTVGSDGFVPGPLVTQTIAPSGENATTGISTAAQTGSGVDGFNQGGIGQPGPQGEVTPSSLDAFNPGLPAQLQPGFPSVPPSLNVTGEETSTTTSSLAFTEAQSNSTIIAASSEGGQNHSGSEATSASEQLPVDQTSAASASTTTSFGFTEARQGEETTSAATSLANNTEQTTTGSSSNNDSTLTTGQQESSTTAGVIAFTSDRNQSFAVVDGQPTEATRSPDSVVISTGAVSTSSDNATFGQLTQLPSFPFPDGNQPTPVPPFGIPQGVPGAELNGTTASPFETSTGSLNISVEATTTGALIGAPDGHELTVAPGAGLNASTDSFTSAGQTTGPTELNGTQAATGPLGETTTSAGIIHPEGQSPTEGGTTQANLSASGTETTTAGGVFLGGESAFSHEEGNSNGTVGLTESGTTQANLGITDSTITTARTNGTGDESSTLFPLPGELPQLPNSSIGTNLGGDSPLGSTLSPTGVLGGENATTAGIAVPEPEGHWNGTGPVPHGEPEPGSVSEPGAGGQVNGTEPGSTGPEPHGEPEPGSVPEPTAGDQWNGTAVVPHGEPEPGAVPEPSGGHSNGSEPATQGEPEPGTQGEPVPGSVPEPGGGEWNGTGGHVPHPEPEPGAEPEPSGEPTVTSEPESPGASEHEGTEHEHESTAEPGADLVTSAHPEPNPEPGAGGIFTLPFSLRLSNIQWTNEFADKTSPQFKKLMEQIEPDLVHVLKPILGEKYSGVSITRLRQGSVIVEGDIQTIGKVEKPEELATVFEETVASRNAQLGGNDVDLKSISVSGFISRNYIEATPTESYKDAGTPGYIIGTAVALGVLAILLIVFGVIACNQKRASRSLRLRESEYVTDGPAAAKTWQQTGGNGHNASGRDQYSGVNLYEMRDIPANRGGPKTNPAFQDDPRNAPMVTAMNDHDRVR